MANRGLSSLPIGLDCERCGQPITVDYIAHSDGDDPDTLVGEAMQQLVIAASRAALKQEGVAQLCSTCLPPRPIRITDRRL